MKYEVLTKTLILILEQEGWKCHINFQIYYTEGTDLYITTGVKVFL